MNPKSVIVFSIVVAAGISAVNIPLVQPVPYDGSKSEIQADVAIPPGVPIMDSESQVYRSASADVSIPPGVPIMNAGMNALTQTQVGSERQVYGSKSEPFDNIDIPPGEPIMNSGMNALSEPEAMIEKDGEESWIVAIPPGDIIDHSERRHVAIPPGEIVEGSEKKVSEIPLGLTSENVASTDIDAMALNGSMPLANANETTSEIQEPVTEVDRTVDSENEDKLTSAENADAHEIENSKSTLEEPDESQTSDKEIADDDPDQSQGDFEADTSLYDQNGGLYGSYPAPGPYPDTALPSPPYPLTPSYPVVDNSLPYGPETIPVSAYGAANVAPEAAYLPSGQVDDCNENSPEMLSPPIYPLHPIPAQVDSLPYGPELPPVPVSSYGLAPPVIPLSDYVEDCEEVAPLLPIGTQYPPVVPPSPPYGGDIYDDCEEDILAPVGLPYPPAPPPYAGDIYDDCEEDVLAYDTYEPGLVSSVGTDDTNPTPELATETPSYTAEMDTLATDLPEAELDTAPTEIESDNASQIGISSATRLVSHSIILLFGISFVLA